MGASVGILGLKFLPNWHIQPGVYAIVAGTATLGGVFRAGICLVSSTLHAHYPWASASA